MTTHKKLIVGSRSSRMALAQTNQFIAVFLEKNQEFKPADIEIKTITTTGDKTKRAARSYRWQGSVRKRDRGTITE